MIVEAASAREGATTAHTFLRLWPTSSRPVHLACEDGREYVVKGVQAGRMIATDSIVGRLGVAMGAPVGTVGLVDVPAELIDIEPRMAHMTPGISHGCVWIPGCSEREDIMHLGHGDNRRRFARLAVLYGWVFANDRQYIYRNRMPFEVYSVDHGHFLPDGPWWTVASLEADEYVVPDPHLIGGCGLTGPDLREACMGLLGINDAVIARAVAAPPDHWGVTLPERVGLAAYLSNRRAQLIRSFLADG